MIAKRALVKLIGCAVLVSKKDYVDLVQQLDEEVNDALWKSEVDRRRLAKRDGKIEALSLKVLLLSDDSVSGAQFQA